MDKEKRDELRRLHEAATKGEWELEIDEYEGEGDDVSGQILITGLNRVKAEALRELAEKMRGMDMDIGAEIADDEADRIERGSVMWIDFEKVTLMTEVDSLRRGWQACEAKLAKATADREDSDRKVMAADEALNAAAYDLTRARDELAKAQAIAARAVEGAEVKP